MKVIYTMKSFMKTSILSIVILLLAGTAFAAEILHVPIKDTIDGGLAAFVERAVGEAKSDGMDAIIFHIDTPGGRIDSALRIKDAILRAEDIVTVAFVDKQAISAGALISIACDSIYMSTGSSIGAATAVDMQGNKASEKVISFFRAEMRATAEATGRRADIAEAMVDEQIEIEGITEKGKLVTLTYTEAKDLGISDGDAETIGDILAAIGKPDAKVIDFKLNWTEYIVRVLTHPIVSSLLMSIGFIGLMIEIRTPGWGVGGTIALIALALFFGSHFIVHLAGIEELILFVAGVVLLGLEIFVIPGFGIAGVSGILLILASLFLSLVGRIPEPDDFLNAAYTIGWSFLFTAVLGYVAIRIFPKTPLFNKLTLADVEDSGKGYISSDSYRDLVGHEGRALGQLRPVGKAEIDGRRLDVVTEGGYIAKDTPVVVTEVDGTRIVVREKEAS